jgi:hypothetical protein
VTDGAGYSGKPLFQKLGLKQGQRAFVWNAPDDYQAELKPLKSSIDLKSRLKGPLDFVHFFATSKTELEQRLPKLKQELDYSGSLWISWPKKSSGLPTDLTENVIRDIAIACGLVDVKVCAVDDTWSGLKLVYRLKDRKQ